MNESLGRGYARIEAIRSARSEPTSGAPGTTSPVPEPDSWNKLYLVFFMAGMAFLLPYNSFLMAVDYFRLHYPGTSIMFDMSTVYIASACVAVVINNMVVDMFSYNARITFGIIVSMVTMIFVAVCNIAWDGFSTSVSYVINLFAIGIVAFGCTVQQSSYYGFTSCLPPRYTQAVMAGESAAGFWVSMDRITTKYSMEKTRESTIVFFTISIMLMFAQAISHFLIVHNRVIKYYVQMTKDARQRRRIQLHLNPNEDANNLMVENDSGEPSGYGVLKLQSPEISTTADADTAFSFANPVYSPSAAAPTSPPAVSEQSVSPPAADTPRPSYVVDDIVYESQEMPTLLSWRSFKRDLQARWAVAQAIYPYMVSIGLVYFTTLSLLPGISSEVPSCTLKSWMPILLLTVFNTFDLLGKIAAAWPYEWSRSQLLMASGLRLLLVPLLLLCAAPRHSPHIVGDVYPIMFTVVLGFTNGLFGSVPMILAPSRVSREHREIAGNMMTLSYNGGLLSGSLVSYLLLSMLGTPSGASGPCKIYPTPLLPTVPPVTLPPNTTFTTTVSH